MKKDIKNGLDFILREHIDNVPSNYLFYLFMILFFITLLIGIIDEYVLKISQLVFLTFGIATFFSFLIWLFLNNYYMKKTLIGKITIAIDKILIKSTSSIVIDMIEIKDLRISFPTQFGNIWNNWGLFSVDSSDNNEISFSYHDKEYLYYFISRDSNDLKALENIIRIWMKNGIQVNYCGPKRRFN